VTAAGELLVLMDGAVKQTCDCYHEHFVSMVNSCKTDL
jgi:hypothetical protein